MSVSFTFSAVSIFYSILLTIMYFSKKRLITIENKIYSWAIIANLFGVILAIASYFFISNMNKYPFINLVVSKLYLVYLLTYISILTLYILVISNKTNDKKSKEKSYKQKFRILSITYLLILLLIFILPLYFHNNNNIIYSYGPCANLIYFVSLVYIIIWLINMFKNYKDLKSKKYIPLFFFILIGGIVIVLQKMNPGLLLMTAMETFVTFLMYFTIENPDVKMLNELYKSKEISEQNYEEKYNFLFEITQEARNPLVKINSICNEIHNTDDKDKIKYGSELIRNLAKQLDFSINNVLNISTFDIQKLKIVNTKYELSNLCNDLILKTKHSLKENVDFRYELPKTPIVLYGDYMKIKQILYSLLNNAVENTNNGYVEFKTNIIERYDVCRIIFKIIDSGKGMPIEEINEVLSATGELDKQELENIEKSEFNIQLCQKVTKIMGGNLIIKSEVGKGTEVTLTFDQKVYHDNETSILNQYEDMINNYKKALIVSQDDKITRRIKHICNNNDITYTSLLYGGDAIDRIKSGKKYDYILIADEMKEMSGLDTLKQLKQIKKFNIPTIILLNSNKEHIKNHYLEDGFSDYILVDDIDNEMIRIINKY